jgi:flagellar motor switch protein FliN/FliY
MPLQELAGLSVGSVIEFDGALGDPVELVVNGRVIARGEAVVLKGCYALRISEIASRQERMFTADDKSSAFKKSALVN